MHFGLVWRYVFSNFLLRRTYGFSTSFQLGTSVKWFELVKVPFSNFISPAEVSLNRRILL